MLFSTSFLFEIGGWFCVRYSHILCYTSIHLLSLWCNASDYLAQFSKQGSSLGAGMQGCLFQASLFVSFNSGTY